MTIRPRPNDPEQTRDDLLCGLIGGHDALYESSATFRASLQILVEMLPAWVDGLADMATEELLAPGVNYDNEEPEDTGDVERRG